MFREARPCHGGSLVSVLTIENETPGRRGRVFKQGGLDANPRKSISKLPVQHIVKFHFASQG